MDLDMGNVSTASGGPYSSAAASKKRSRVEDGTTDDARIAAVELTTTTTSSSSKSKSKSKLVVEPEKPKTQKQLNEELNLFRCSNLSCCKDQGGCFLKNFCSADQSSILMDNAISVLQLYREKTRILTRDEEGDLALFLFKSKCTNLAGVVSPTTVDSHLLHGEGIITFVIIKLILL
jgi:hypothetical protein